MVYSRPEMQRCRARRCWPPQGKDVRLKLRGEQMEALVSALSQRFTLAELRRLTRFKLGTDYDDIVSEGAKKIDAVFEIVDFADRRSHVNQLLQGARGLNPTLAEIEQIFELAGVSAVPAAVKTRVNELVLERIVSRRSVFQDPASFRARLSRIETWVCRIDVPGAGGTGLLVQPDLVLTNHHVMQPVYSGAVSRDDVAFRFDFRAFADGSVLVAETRYGLAPDWDVDRSPPSDQDTIVGGAEPKADELDYALLRLARPIGNESIGSTDPQAPPRGWFDVPATTPAILENEPLFVLQYPSDLRLQLAVGAVLGHSPGGTRLRHNARTLGGSSGSPCFDANLAMVALHHAGDPDYGTGHAPTYNQAIPLGRILALMSQHQVPALSKGNAA